MQRQADAVERLALMALMVGKFSEQVQGCTRHCICGCAEGAEWSDGDGRAVWGGVG